MDKPSVYHDYHGQTPTGQINVVENIFSIKKSLQCRSEEDLSSSHLIDDSSIHANLAIVVFAYLETWRDGFLRDLAASQPSFIRYDEFRTEQTFQNTRQCS